MPTTATYLNGVMNLLACQSEMAARSEARSRLRRRSSSRDPYFAVRGKLIANCRSNSRVAFRLAGRP